MARLIINDAHGPKEVKIGNESAWVCMCGISQNKPFCDGSHKKTKDEQVGKTYVYSKDGSNKIEIENE